MGVSEPPLGPRLRGLRLRVLVHDSEVHPPVPPGTVVNALGDPGRPDFLVIELDSPIEVPRPSGPGSVSILHLAVSPIGWDWEVLFRPISDWEGPMRPPAPFPPPLFVQVWHVFDSRLATSQEWTTDTLVYVAKGGLSRRFTERTQP